MLFYFETLKYHTDIYDILKYRIGYCTNGLYNGKIIIPSYDANGSLNYFVGRAYYDTDYKHKNPNASKDIVGFELHINWNMPIILVEGAFDAIAIKRNAIPLFGKTISNTLKKRIVEKGVKASGTRARKALAELGKLLKARRKEIQESKNAAKVAS